MEATLAGGRRNNCHLEDLEGVVAVGGGAQLPWLRRWLAENTAPAPLLTPPPVEAVALGALKLTPGSQFEMS
jgi:molecular chaperone DnaK (HSP70)